jgi:hypothetical protein
MNTKRGDLWQCSRCNAWNDPSRLRCMNGCGNDAPIEVP